MTTKLNQSETQNARIKRRNNAQKLYSQHLNSLTQTQIPPHQTTWHLVTVQHKQEDVGKRGYSDLESLKMLEWVAGGRSLVDLQVQSDFFRKCELKKIHNIFHGTLLKLSKTFLDILPKNLCPFSPSNFKKVYLKNTAMIAYYSSSGLNIVELFYKLIFMRNWEKQFNWYLVKGYGNDYMPEDVVNVLEDLTQNYRHLIYLFENAGFDRGKTEKARRIQNQDTITPVSSEE